MKENQLINENEHKEIESITSKILSNLPFLYSLCNNNKNYNRSVVK